MADRTVHYEAAFEAFLRQRRIPYVAVDEAKKALFANAKLKSFDFVVYPPDKPRLLVDVKGRSLRNRAKRSGFETWATEADVKDLLQWEQVFGEGFTAVFGFVYWIDPPLFGVETMGVKEEMGRGWGAGGAAGGVVRRHLPSSIRHPRLLLFCPLTRLLVLRTSRGFFSFGSGGIC